MALIHGWSGRRYRTDDVALVEELARRVGLALANARLYVAEQDARRAAEHERDLVPSASSGSRDSSRRRRPSPPWRRWCSPRPAPPSTRPRAASTSSRPMATPWRSSSPTATCPVSSTSSGASRSRPTRPWPPPRAPARRCGCRTSASCAAGSPKLARALRRATHRAAVAIPLRAEGRVLGALGLSFPQVRTFSAADQGFVLALAELAAQGIARAILGAARAELMLALDAQRARLEAVVEQAPVGVVIADAATGRLLLGNAGGRPDLRSPVRARRRRGSRSARVRAPRTGASWRPTRPPWRVRCAARSSRRRSWASSAPTDRARRSSRGRRPSARRTGRSARRWSP